jgi:hypothetical protein
VSKLETRAMMGLVLVCMVAGRGGDEVDVAECASIAFGCMAKSQITVCVEVGVMASAGGQSVKECRDCKRYFGLTYVFHCCNAYVGMYMLFDSLSFLLKSTPSCQRICASRVWREHFKRTSLYHLTFMSGQRIHALIPAWPMHASQRQKQRCRPP